MELGVDVANPDAESPSDVVYLRLLGLVPVHVANEGGAAPLQDEPEVSALLADPPRRGGDHCSDALRYCCGGVDVPPLGHWASADAAEPGRDAAAELCDGSHHYALARSPFLPHAPCLPPLAHHPGAGPRQGALPVCACATPQELHTHRLRWNQHACCGGHVLLWAAGSLHGLLRSLAPGHGSCLHVRLRCGGLAGPRWVPLAWLRGLLPPVTPRALRLQLWGPTHPPGPVDGHLLRQQG
mmetsp:Transcript_119809/g.284670  ORF Transcript_119809/g.284670 Transcript_119809/m.284670 type:complete len:240 (-) Transcript_119809:123-842(-)